MPSPRVPLASWCPVCQSRDISAAPLDLGAIVDGAPATVKPWSCRACGALWMMALPLKVMQAPPASPAGELMRGAAALGRGRK